MIDNNQKYFFRPTIPPKEYLKNQNSYQDEENNILSSNSENNNKTRNILLASLVALATATIPTIAILDKPIKANVSYDFDNNANNKLEIICNPELIAKGGKNDNMIEIKEFLNLLDFSGMKNLPKNTQSTIEMIASAHYQPIITSDEHAKEKLISQVEKIQKMVDNCIENSIKNPSKTHEQKLFEHNAKYISSKEIMNQIDFSELIKYQKDISVLKAILRNSVEPIKRDAFDCWEQKQKAINQAQTYVNKLVEQYKKYAQIAGNSDYNNSLSTTEFIELLDKGSLEGIDKITKKEIINKATTNYKPIIFDKIQNKKAIKETNQKICEEVQKAQNILDSEALIYKLNNIENQ